MKFKGNASSKNLLAKRLAELTGKPAIYTGAPAFSYTIGDYHVSRNGTLEVDENLAERSIISTLVREQLIQGTESIATESVEVPPTIPKPVVEKSDDHTKEKKRKSYGDAVVIKDRFIPVQTMINLINMIGAKGEVLSKSIGKANAFWVSDNIIYDLPYEDPKTFDDLHRILQTADGKLVRGIEFTPKSVILSGFPKTNDIVVRGAYETLAEAMYKYASTRKWVSCRRMDSSNEKYYFRIWLNHLGLGGPENKTYREIFMKNLDGNCSYRTRSQLIAHRNYQSKKQNTTETTASATM